MSFEPEDYVEMVNNKEISETIDVQRQLFNDLHMQGKISEDEWNKFWVDSQEVVSLLRIAYRRIIQTTVEIQKMEDERRVFENISLLEFLPEIFDMIEARMVIDDKRWGQEWLARPIQESEIWENQDTRIFGRFDTYFEEGKEDTEDGVMTVDHWLKVIGNAMIAIVRLRHPELFPNGQVHPDWVEDIEED